MVSPELDTHKYCPLIFDKGAMAIQWRRDSQILLEQLDVHMQEKNSRPILYTFHKITTKITKCIPDLAVKRKLQNF